MSETVAKPVQSKKGTWGGALASLSVSILLVLGIRWLLIEAYVIPSGSMLPTLQINDHLFVNKLKFGIRLPFSSTWLLRYAEIERGQIVVFRSVQDPDVFFVKRIIGIGGDQIDYSRDGVLRINGEVVVRAPVADVETIERDGGFQINDEFDVFRERIGEREFYSLLRRGALRSDYSETVPEKHFLVIGDNRDNSSDSRYWGVVSEDHLLGTPWFIWLSCRSENVRAVAQCPPEQIRWDRFGKRVE